MAAEAAGAARDEAAAVVVAAVAKVWGVEWARAVVKARDKAEAWDVEWVRAPDRVRAWAVRSTRMRLPRRRWTSRQFPRKMTSRT